MMDQREKYSPKGLVTEYVGGEQIDSSVKEQVLNGEVQLVFITPESLIRNPDYRKMLLSPPYANKVVAVVVDEAHCVKLWGDKFRPVFAEVGDVRSLVPSNVRMMALTATATTETFYVVTNRLAMQSPCLVSLPPHRDNIVYRVKPKVSLEEFVTSIHGGLKTLGSKYPKTLVYVRTYTNCSEIYKLLKKSLGPEFTHPPGYPNLKDYRLVDMFSKVETTDKKEEVLKSFAKVDGVLRLLIATSAFGMGVDCPDIRRVIHWGAPTTLEEYVQETGRSRRDGDLSIATMYRGVGLKHATMKVKSYLLNTASCRRKFLFQDFLMYREQDINVSGCNCCDVCAKVCVCNLCSKK